MKRGTEDLDFFIGDEALAAANGPGERRQDESTVNILIVKAMAYIILFAMGKSRIG
jgi:hypothetical protein